MRTSTGLDFTGYRRGTSLVQPFSQGPGSPGQANGGLGLGLALSKALVELHGGRIEARSAGSGAGSELEVVLPLSEPPARGHLESAPREPCAQRRVLVIEDNPDAAETMRMALEIEGHDVDVAADGIVGLDKARALRPDVILCDLGIPGIDGFEVARRLRGDPSLAPRSLIALSGYAMEEDRLRSAAAGFDAHLAKPVEMRALGDLIARLSPAAEARAPVS